MKKYLIYFLLASLLGQSSRQVWVMVSFYWNQAYIAENLCVNRFEAITVCGGKCYLIKKLGETEDAPSSAQVTSPSQEITWFSPEVPFALSPLTAETPVFLLIPYVGPTVPLKPTGSVFHPPQVQYTLFA
jgi:hypothetical protein